MTKENNLQKKLKDLASVAGERVINEALRDRNERNFYSTIRNCTPPEGYNNIFEYVAHEAGAKPKRSKELFPKIISQLEREILTQLYQEMGAKVFYKTAYAMAVKKNNEFWQNRCKNWGGELPLNEFRRVLELLQGDKPVTPVVKKNLSGEHPRARHSRIKANPSSFTQGFNLHNINQHLYPAGAGGI